MIFLTTARSAASSDVAVFGYDLAQGIEAVIAMLDVPWSANAFDLSVSPTARQCFSNPRSLSPLPLDAAGMRDSAQTCAHRVLFFFSRLLPFPLASERLGDAKRPRAAPPNAQSTREKFFSVTVVGPVSQPPRAHTHTHTHTHRRARTLQTSAPTPKRESKKYRGRDGVAGHDRAQLLCGSARGGGGALFRVWRLERPRSVRASERVVPAPGAAAGRISRGGSRRHATRRGGIACHVADAARAVARRSHRHCTQAGRCSSGLGRTDARSAHSSGARSVAGESVRPRRWRRYRRQRQQRRRHQLRRDRPRLGILGRRR